MGKTLSQRVWESHVVRRSPGEPDLVYIDMHLLHEVTSPQAYEGLRRNGRRLRRPELTVGTMDHDIPTKDIDLPISDPVGAKQVSLMYSNCADFGVRLYPLGDPGQGIVHVIGPQLGLTQPGMTIVCGDSHTSTHGAFGALAFGIGTSQVEHVMATQALPAACPDAMSVRVEGDLPSEVTAKDVALGIINRIGTAGGVGAVIEYRGAAIRSLSMEGRMTLCNMTIEAGARAGMVAPDEKTYDYLKGREHSPQGDLWDEAVAYWQTLRTDDDAEFDREVVIDAASLRPAVTWGTNPSQSVPLDGAVPDPGSFDDPDERGAAERSLRYMDLSPGTRMRDIPVDAVFIGSCTNGRLEDLEAAARVLSGRRVAEGVRALVVPGSMLVKLEAEKRGLDRAFVEAGFEWRSAGCSMCVGMNNDVLLPGQRSASTSNRNFEGRQGPGARTHLVSPAVAAATAVSGRLASPSDL